MSRNYPNMTAITKLGKGVKRFELIIFDCDGVLVDSERISNRIFMNILEQECGLSFSLEQMFDIFVGHSSEYCMSVLKDMLGETPPASIEARYRLEINKALEESVTIVNGIDQALEEISIPYCVASSGSHEKMRTTLGKTGLLGHFKGKLHSTSDVERGKPYPDIYLHAARNMECVSPEKCLVIEDIPPGVEGAIAAGMVVFGYAELMREDRLISAGAHHTFKDMSKLYSEIKNFELPP